MDHPILGDLNMTMSKIKRMFDRVRFKKWLFSWFCRHFLDHVVYPKEDVYKILSEHDDFLVAYVYRYKNQMLHYALNRQIAYRRLPLIEASAFSFKKNQKTFLEAANARKKAVEFFLRTPKTALVNKNDSPNYVQMLIHLQKQIDKPIILLPHVLLLGNRPHQIQPSTTDMIFGSRHEPGFLRFLIRVILCHRWARWQIAEPFNLRSFVDDHQNQTEEKLAKQVRWQLLRRINNLERSYYGPPFKSHSRIMSDTLSDKTLQDYIETVKIQTGTPKNKLEKKARNYYQEIAARFDIDLIRILNKLFGFIWKKTSDGLMWSASDIENIKKASQKGPLIIVPSHKSHLDYVVLSQIFFWEGLMLPHIAAGANLSFFPVGSLFRLGGAFFIRRTFKGDPLYPQVVKAYVKHLLKESFTLEFFIEGGRSRTGKTLAPKLGFLSIIIDCLTQGKAQEAMFLPASISYEKLIEAKSYQKELMGGEKKKENAQGLLKSTKVLKKKFGRIYVSFDKPISFLEFVKERGLDVNHLSDGNKKEIVKSLAHHIVYGMNHCSIITPTSLIAVALFGSPRRTLSHALLIWHIKKIVAYIRENNPDARFSDEFISDYRNPVERALQLLIEDKLIDTEKAGKTIYYRIHKSSALLIDYYKNNILHYFVSDAVLATAFTALFEKNRRKQVLKIDLEKYTHFLSQIFKYEFAYPVGMLFHVLFEKHLKKAIDKHMLTLNGNHVCLSTNSDAFMQLQFATRLLGNFVDAYWVCFQKLPQAIKKATNHKSLVVCLLEHLKEAYLSGISDCPEIVSKSIVENALQLFSDYHLLSYENGKFVLSGKRSIEKLKFFTMVLRKSHYNR